MLVVWFVRNSTVFAVLGKNASEITGYNVITFSEHALVQSKLHIDHQPLPSTLKRHLWYITAGVLWPSHLDMRKHATHGVWHLISGITYRPVYQASGGDNHQNHVRSKSSSAIAVYSQDSLGGGRPVPERTQLVAIYCQAPPSLRQNVDAVAVLLLYSGRTRQVNEKDTIHTS